MWHVFMNEPANTALHKVRQLASAKASRRLSVRALLYLWHIVEASVKFKHALKDFAHGNPTCHGSCALSDFVH